MDWLHNSKTMLSHEDFTDDVIGFVYLINYTDGKKYIGKKLIRGYRRLKPTLAQLAIRKNYVRTEMVDLPFTKYEGSSKETEGHIVLNKTILTLCDSKINLTYYEMKEMFARNVLLDETYLNKNISGKLFRGKITEC